MKRTIFFLFALAICSSAQEPEVHIWSTGWNKQFDSQFSITAPSPDKVLPATLPDTPVRQEPAPAAEPKCGPKWAGGCWDYSHKQLTWKQALTSKQFLIPNLVYQGASWFDSIVTVEGIKHGKCLESNTDLPRRPGLGDVTIDWARTDLLMSGFNLAMVKLNRRFTNYVNFGTSGYGAAIHFKGGITWLTTPHCW